MDAVAASNRLAELERSFVSSPAHRHSRRSRSRAVIFLTGVAIAAAVVTSVAWSIEKGLGASGDGAEASSSPEPNPSSVSTAPENVAPAAFIEANPSSASTAPESVPPAASTSALTDDAESDLGLANVADESEPAPAQEAAPAADSPVQESDDFAPGRRAGETRVESDEATQRDADGGREEAAEEGRRIARAQRAYAQGDLQKAQDLLIAASDRDPSVAEARNLEEKIVALGRLENLLAIGERSEANDPLLSLRAMEKALAADAMLGGALSSSIRLDLAEVATDAARHFMARGDRKAARKAADVAVRHDAGKRVESVLRSLDRDAR